MTDFPSLLFQDSANGARVLALHFLARTRRALKRVRKHPGREDPVHQARIAITQLRATLALYEGPLDGALNTDDRRTLRALHRGLGTARDLDVQLLWIDGARQSLPSRARRDAEWLQGELEAARTRENPRILRAISRHFDPHAKRWTRQLRYYTQDRVAGEPAAFGPLSGYLRSQLAHQTARVAVALQRAEADGATREELHRLRRRIKRLRALLRPWRNAMADATPLYAQLSAAQTSLGTMRDTDLLAELARAARRRRGGRLVPLAALADELDQAANAAEAEFVRSWFGGGATRLETAASAVARSLAERPADAGQANAAPENAAPENAAPENAAPPVPVEIERKYLLTGVPPEALAAPAVRIAQGWLPGKVLRERLRRTVHPDGHVEWTRTVKAGTGVARVELEEPASAMLFESLWPFTASARVEKVRHTVPDDTLAWEVDVFLDRPLVLAEVELPSADTPVTIPAWLAPYVEREVTGDATYVNANLAYDTRRPPVAR